MIDDGEGQDYQGVSLFNQLYNCNWPPPNKVNVNTGNKGGKGVQHDLFLPSREVAAGYSLRIIYLSLACMYASPTRRKKHVHL
jgi:hypothetical protein